MFSIETVVLQTDPVANVEQLIEGFGQVAANGDPLSIALLVIGAVLTGIAAGGFGLLAAGGLLSGLARALSREPPRGA
jgi:urea transporter